MAHICTEEEGVCQSASPLRDINIACATEKEVKCREKGTQFEMCVGGGGSLSGRSPAKKKGKVYENAATR